jgi:uncharacterized membrane protein required for colicin V production
MTLSTKVADTSQTPSSGVAGRLVVALLVFVLLIALSLLIPRALPGELSAEELTPHGILLCRACPPTEQITGAGLAAASDGWHLNVRFAAPPFNTILRVSFDGIPGVMEIQHTGQSWQYTRPLPAGFPKLMNTAERDALAVFSFPASSRLNGFAIHTGSGDQLPESGFLAPTYPAAPHFNATDVVLLLILAGMAWYGFTRGFLLEVVDLLSIVVSLIIARIAYRPLAGLFTQMTNSPAAGAILGSGLLVLALALVGIFLARRYFARHDQSGGSFDPQINGILGGAVGCVRQIPILAMLLTAGTDLAVLHWATASIRSSLLGTALLRAWSTLFSAG